MSIFTYENLYRAYLDCRKNKRKTINALKFEYNLEENLYHLLKELQGRVYRPGRSICFIVREPKPREIFAADFRDRIVHHLFVREILDYAEKRFIYDSYACRPEKGTHKAVKRVKDFIRKFKRRGSRLHYMQLDIRAFFPNIDQQILFRIVARLVNKIKKPENWREEMLWLARKIIFYDAGRHYRYKGDVRLKKLIPKEKSLFFQKPGKGLPIGNYTSQFFANLYLNELDQFVKNELECQNYIRYVDDFIIVGDGSSFYEWKNGIGKFLKDKLGLEIGRDKVKIKPVNSGLDFLGYYIKEDYTLVRRRVVRRLKAKFYCPIISKDKLQEVVASYFAHFKYADSWRLRTRVVKQQLNYIY